jgi:hypothetical protein
MHFIEPPADFPNFAQAYQSLTEATPGQIYGASGVGGIIEALEACWLTLNGGLAGAWGWINNSARVVLSTDCGTISRPTKLLTVGGKFTYFGQTVSGLNLIHYRGMPHGPCYVQAWVDGEPKATSFMVNSSQGYMSSGYAGGAGTGALIAGTGLIFPGGPIGNLASTAYDHLRY